MAQIPPNALLAAVSSAAPGAGASDVAAGDQPPEPVAATKRRYISVNVKYVDTIWVEPHVVVHANKLDHNGRSRWAVWKLGAPRWAQQEPEPGTTIDADALGGEAIDVDAALAAADGLADAPADGAAAGAEGEEGQGRRRKQRRA